MQQFLSIALSDYGMFIVLLFLYAVGWSVVPREEANGVSRLEQEKWAVASHTKAAAAVVGVLLLYRAVKLAYFHEFNSYAFVDICRQTGSFPLRSHQSRQVGRSVPGYLRISIGKCRHQLTSCFQRALFHQNPTNKMIVLRYIISFALCYAQVYMQHTHTRTHVRTKQSAKHITHTHRKET